MTPGSAIEAGVASPDRMTFTDEFKSRVDLTKAFCETAKIYIQISSAALALPMVFTQAILGRETAEKGLRTVGVARSLLLAWIFFLLAIAFGLAYQWLAVRGVWDELYTVQFTPQKKDERGFRKTWWVLQPQWLNRSALYGGMVVFFYLGAILFVVFAASTLRN